MRYLKQGSTVTVKMGPFVDATDGVTEETAITPVVEVSKAGGAFAARNSATAIAHDAEGWYDVELDGTDTGTVGNLVAKAQDSATHLPVWHEFTVLPAQVYDSLVGGTDSLEVDTTLIEGVDATNQVRDSVLSDATPFAGANIDAAISSRSSHAAAAVLAETLSELSQAQPSATPTLADAIMLGYMAMRNAEEQDASEYRIKDDAGTVVAKAALSDDGTTVVKAKMASGP